MWMSLVVIGLVVVMALVWATRGFFSALLHLVCTLCAGAIALALWEPLAYWLLGSQEPGTLVDVAWGVCLIGPFVLALTLLSVACSALIRNNIKVGDMPGLIGGGILGAAAGFITAGIVVLGVGMTRTQSDFFDYTPIDTDNQGSVIRSGGLWVPADRMVASLYGFMSKGSLASSAPLARYYPHLADSGHMFRNGSKGDTLLKYTIRPKDVALKGRYTVGLKEKTTLPDLVGDNKAVLDIDGNKVSGGSYYIEGVAVQFKAGAKEKGGQIVISPAHVQLVCANSSGAEVFMPIAMISQAKGDSVTFGRWRFDAKDVLLGSVGSANDPIMLFEFVVPKYAAGDELQPVALYVKGVRLDLYDRDSETSLKPSKALASGADRDAGLNDLAQLYKDKSDVISGQAEIWNRETGNTFESLVAITNRLPDRIILSSDNVGELELNEGNFIMDGVCNLDAQKGLLQRGADRKLIVDRFYPGEGTSIVLVDVTPGKDFAITAAPSADAPGAPSLVDDQNMKHGCVGYVYRDESLISIYFKPGDPITDKSKIRSISRSRTDQKLWLVFRVPNGVKLTRYVIGTTPVKEFGQPMPIDGTGQAR
ncbi:MAG: hypothetical protein ACREJO_16955 [Phycisphaerales bacterium]